LLPDIWTIIIVIFKNQSALANALRHAISALDLMKVQIPGLTLLLLGGEQKCLFCQRPTTSKPLYCSYIAHSAKENVFGG
jgi:hypothetical protein